MDLRELPASEIALGYLGIVDCRLDGALGGSIGIGMRLAPAIRDQFPMATSVAFEGAVEQTGDEELMTFMSYGFRVSLTSGQQFDIVITGR